MGLVKPIGMGLAMLMVVGIAIGLIVGVRDANSGGGSDTSDNDLSSTSKAVRAFCEPTNYKKPCVDSLSSLANNGSATPKEFFQLAISAALDALNGTIDKTDFISRDVQDQEQKFAFKDCKTMLRYAMDELHEAWEKMGKVSLDVRGDKADELRNWLSATISYQQSCVDIVDPPLKEAMMHGMQNASELTSNVLAMVTEFKQIFKDLGIAIKEMAVKKSNSSSTSSQRRLLEAGPGCRYPGWISAGDRKLLEVKNIGRMGTPNAVVAQDGTGRYRTIGAAIQAYPKGLMKGRYVIYVKAGVYNEQVVIEKDMKNIFMYGDGPRRTIVTGNLNKAQGTNTWRSATFAAIGNGFICKSMGFQNTAGPEGHQAVALRVQSDQSVFYNCRIDGFQDSLYVQAHRQFYRNCVISGTVDFIFGDSIAFIQNSLIIVRRPMDNQQNTVTAQGKFDAREPTGLVIQNCRVVPDRALFPDRFKIQSFLGRPWKEYSTTVFMESTLADFVQPAGWMPWQGSFALDTLFYGEYGNRGPGADTTHRVDWKGFKVITDRNEASTWTVGLFLQGQDWIPATSTPFLAGLRY